MCRLFSSLSFSVALLVIASAQPTFAQQVYDFGHHPDGTWAELVRISDSGVAVGLGDVAGDRRMIGVRLFGPNAGNWFESGVSSNTMGGRAAISNTGMIAGTIRGDNGFPEAYAWFPNHAGFHLGTLPGDTWSLAFEINHQGTFIVGQSFHGLPGQPTTTGRAVVWTSRVDWTHGAPTLAWDIHALPTNGLEEPGAVFEGVTLRLWGAWGVNDSGQIAGDAYEFYPSTGQYWEIAVVWNPTKAGSEWEIQRLPMADDFVYNEALSINNRGEIVGDVWDWRAAPALWRNQGKTWELTVLPTLNSTPMWDVATDINDSGDVVGTCYYAGWIPQATRWNAHAPLAPAQALGFPDDWSVARGVNNSGVVVGGYGTGGNPEQAVAMKPH